MRTKRHIVFMPAPAHGHINPTMGLASSLVDLGHRVTYIVPERFHQQLTAVGVGVIDSSDAIANEGFRPGDFADIDKSIEKIGTIQAHKKIMNDPPDLMLYDRYRAAGTYVSMKMPDVPAIKMFPTFAENQLVDLPRIGFGNIGGIMDAMKGMSDLFQWEEFSKEYFFGIAKINLVFLPRFFQYEGSSFDERFQFVGPQVTDRKFYGRWSPSATGGGRIILVSIGTVHNIQPKLFRSFIDQLSGRGWHIVMSVGPRFDIDCMGVMPADVEIHNFISHTDVLRHADAFIGHGGMGSTMEALYFGVPMILIPQDSHQEHIAQRVMELGLGRVLPGVDNVNLELALRDLFMDRQLSERVEEKSLEMRKEKSIEKAVDVVLRHL